MGELDWFQHHCVRDYALSPAWASGCVVPPSSTTSGGLADAVDSRDMVAMKKKIAHLTDDLSRLASSLAESVEESVAKRTSQFVTKGYLVELLRESHAESLKSVQAMVADLQDKSASCIVEKTAEMLRAYDGLISVKLQKFVTD